MMTMRTARMGALLLLAPTVQAVMNAGGVPCKLHPTSQEGGRGSRGRTARCLEHRTDRCAPCLCPAPHASLARPLRVLMHGVWSGCSPPLCLLVACRHDQQPEPGHGRLLDRVRGRVVRVLRRLRGGSDALLPGRSHISLFFFARRSRCLLATLFLYEADESLRLVRSTGLALPTFPCLTTSSSDSKAKSWQSPGTRSIK